MKPKFLPTIVIIFLSLSIKAQWNASFNTGANAQGSGKLPVNSNDLNWTASLGNINGPYQVAKTVPATFWSSGSYTNATWISYPHACAGTTNQSVSYCAGPDHDEYYRVMFSLNTQEYSLCWEAYADNSVHRIYLNGKQVYANPQLSNPYNQNGFSNIVSGSINNGWAIGTNTILVHVKSGIDPNSNLTSLTGLLFKAVSGCSEAVGLSKQVEDWEMTMFPNPARSDLSIDLSGSIGNDNRRFTLLDGHGKIVLSQTIDPAASDLTVDLSDVSNGVYHCVIESKGQSVSTKRLILLH